MAKTDREIQRDFGAEITNHINEIDRLNSLKESTADLTFITKNIAGIDTAIDNEETALLQTVNSLQAYLGKTVNTKLPKVVEDKILGIETPQ